MPGIEDLRHDMQATENLFAGKLSSTDEIKKAVDMLIASWSDTQLQKEMSNVILSTKSFESYPHLEDVIYLTRYAVSIEATLAKTETALNKLKEKPLEEDEKITLKEYALIHDVAKLLPTLKQLPATVIQSNSELQQFYQQVERCQNIEKTCEKFTLEKASSDMTVFLPQAKATAAEWLLALQKHLVRMTPIEPPRPDYFPMQG